MKIGQYNFEQVYRKKRVYIKKKKNSEGCRALNSNKILKDKTLSKNTEIKIYTTIRPTVTYATETAN